MTAAPPPQSSPVQLVGEMISHDTVQVLCELLRQARAGKVIGLAIVSLQARHRYEFALTGIAQRSPTFALGAVHKLAHDIAERIDRHAMPSTQS